MALTKSRTADARGRSRFIVLSLAPAVLLYVLFMVLPTIDVFRMSLYQWTGVGGTPVFIGFENFVALVSDMQFVRAFQNTVFLIVLVTIVTMTLALFLSALMTQGRLRARSLYRFILYLPSVLSIVVVAAIFSAIYDQRNGLVNGSLYFVGWDNLAQVWLGDQKIIMYSIGFAMVWQSVGYYLVLYMAGMSNIPAELYEAASLDGAGDFRRFFDVTLPLVWQTIRTSLVFFVLSSINLAFVFVKAMTSGGPDGSSEVLLDYMYKQAYTNSSYGYGMSIGVTIFVFSFALALIINRVTKREVYQY